MGFAEELCLSLPQVEMCLSLPQGYCQAIRAQRLVPRTYQGLWSYLRTYWGLWSYLRTWQAMAKIGLPCLDSLVRTTVITQAKECQAKP